MASELRVSARVRVTVDDEVVMVGDGTTVAVAVALAGKAASHRSVAGQARGPLCGMGVCFECRVTVDGRAHVRGCQTLCAEGMEVRTDG